MKKRTEAKREAILEAASAVFREVGFHKASMNAIAARLGGSKMTLYSYFPSKEAIFLEVVRRVSDSKNRQLTSFLGEAPSAMTEISRKMANAAFGALKHPISNIEATLRGFGEKYLTFVYSPEILSIRRVLFAESARSETGRFYYENGPKKTTQLIASFLEKAVENGQLKASTPIAVAAVHLRSLLNAEWIERCFFDTAAPVSPERIAQTVEEAVRVFLAAYGVPESEGAKRSSR